MLRGGTNSKLLRQNYKKNIAVAHSIAYGVLNMDYQALHRFISHSRLFAAIHRSNEKNSRFLPPLPVLRSAGAGYRRASGGFTLVDIVIAITIFAILAAFATSGIHDWLVQRGLTTAVDQLQADLQQAKLLAIKQHLRCTLTINSPGVKDYAISLSNEVVNLGQYLGQVTFDSSSTPSITFTPWGTSTSGTIQLVNQANTVTYRLVISLAGGISKEVKEGTNWVPSSI